MKVAVDFLSPHNMALCLQMAQEIRGDNHNPQTDLAQWYALPDGVLAKQEKLQSEPILLHAAYAVLQRLNLA